MAENPYLVSKTNRLKFMYNYIRSNQPIEPKKVFAIMEFNHGLSRRTIREYFQTLKDLGSIVAKNGLISVKEESKKWHPPPPYITPFIF